MKVIWLQPARKDRRRTLAYLAECNPNAAVRLVEELIQAADNLATFPNRGRPGRAPGTRELAAAHPYILDMP